MGINQNLRQSDPDIATIIQNERLRQSEGLELIASENFVSRAVLEAQGSILTNKYAEGYPGKRYYGGCRLVDEIENLAITRAKQLFGAEYVNVQPHSGSQANMAAYFAVLKPGDTILSMNLAHGGHLSHGSPVNFSGKLFNIIPYGVSDKDHRIDYNQLADLAKTHRPQLIVAGFSSYARALDFKVFRDIADSVGALLMADVAHPAGLIAAHIYPNPMPYCDIVTTTTHKTLRGPRGGMIMAKEAFGKKINSSVFPGIQGGPLMHVIAAKAVAFKEALTDEFVSYQKQVLANSQKLASELSKRGFNIITGGTDCHLFLVQLANGLTGKLAEERLEQAGITVNKNMIPFDTESPFVTSGLRLGTPALTTRGMKETEMVQIADMITEVIQNIHDDAVVDNVKSNVTQLCAKFPLYV